MGADRDPIGRINLKLLQTFVLVADNHSFRAAADRAHRSQSAITAQIKQLEAQVGVPLFRRTTRDVQLTLEGEQLLVSTQRALRELGAGVRQLHEAVDRKRGLVALACSSTVAANFLPATLHRFSAKYPQVRITLRETLSSEFIDYLQRGHADFCVGPAVEHADLQSEILFDDPLVALVPRRLMRKERASIALRAIAGMPLAIFGPATAIRTQVEKAFRDAGLDLAPQYECRQAQTLIALAEASLGVAILTRSALRHYMPQHCRILAISDPRLDRPVAIVRLRGQSLAPCAASLVDLLRVECAPAVADGGASRRRARTAKRPASMVAG